MNFLSIFRAILAALEAVLGAVSLNGSASASPQQKVEAVGTAHGKLREAMALVDEHEQKQNDDPSDGESNQV